ncbi:hypothetical protein P278_10020 [Zhouia amylolytica AD3]|uniref:Uncharacterized protein n=1 Tax=Zhouia amylolytica AD3 TaxID=1286632 RepID=W2UMC3_9FLAO|nr:hypothetical protein P278_10020 [Zhouia amylolytica AD3]
MWDQMIEYFPLMAIANSRVGKVKGPGKFMLAVMSLSGF